MNKLDWCFNVKGGLKEIDPSKEIASSYLEEAEKTLSKIKRCIDEEDFIWASVRIYYCAYYSLYSFLQRIGIKSENHDCSIELVNKLIQENIKEKMEFFKKCRIDAQYYLKVGQKEKLLKFYLDVKNFYLEFKDLVKNLNDSDVKKYKDNIK
jgi:uncharacterized protein (UPF0332 family)